MSLHHLDVSIVKDTIIYSKIAEEEKSLPLLLYVQGVGKKDTVTKLLIKEELLGNALKSQDAQTAKAPM